MVRLGSVKYFSAKLVWREEYRFQYHSYSEIGLYLRQGHFWELCVSEETRKDLNFFVCFDIAHDL